MLLAFVVHLDLRYEIGILGSNVQRVDSRLQLGLKLRLEVVGGLLNLDGDEIAGFSLKTSLHFPADLISFSFFDQSLLVVLLYQVKFLLEFLLRHSLLRDASIVLLDLVFDLLLLGQATDLQMATLAITLQMQRNVLEDRSHLLWWLLLNPLAKLVGIGKIVRVEDFVFAT